VVSAVEVAASVVAASVLAASVVMSLGQLGSSVGHSPQFPRTVSPFASTMVEHQGVVYPPSTVQVV